MTSYIYERTTEFDRSKTIIHLRTCETKKSIIPRTTWTTMPINAESVFVSTTVYMGTGRALSMRCWKSIVVEYSNVKYGGLGLEFWMLSIPTLTETLNKQMLFLVLTQMHHWRTSNVVWNHSPILPLMNISLVARSYRRYITWIKLLPMLYCLMIAHRAACHTRSNAFLKYIKIWRRSCGCWRYIFFRLNIMFSRAPAYSKTRLFFGDNLTSCVISNTFLVRIMWFTV